VSRVAPSKSAIYKRQSMAGIEGDMDVRRIHF
jgi:hypothetical protein